MTMNIFERASRAGLMVKIPNGTVCVDQLWGMYLTRLNAIAVGLSRSIKTFGDENFIGEQRATKFETETKLAFEIVKHIIASRLVDAERAKGATVRADLKKKLENALANKQNAALDGKTEEQLMAELAALTGGTE